MALTHVLSIDEANAAVDWRTLLLLGGLIPPGKATQDTGTAAWLANGSPAVTVVFYGPITGRW